MEKSPVLVAKPGRAPNFFSPWPQPCPTAAPLSPVPGSPVPSHCRCLHTTVPPPLPLVRPWVPPIPRCSPGVPVPLPWCFPPGAPHPPRSPHCCCPLPGAPRPSVPVPLDRTSRCPPEHPIHGPGSAPVPLAVRPPGPYRCSPVTSLVLPQAPSCCSPRIPHGSPLVPPSTPVGPLPRPPPRWSPPDFPVRP